MSKTKPKQELAPPSPPPLRLCNAFAKLNKESITLFEKCYFTLPPHVHSYFFRHLFAGRRGVYQELTSTFYARLYDECHRVGLTGERAVWDPSNEQIVAEILSKLNFNDNTELTNELARVRAELDAERLRSASLRPKVSDSSGSPRKRRAAKGADVAPRQP